MRERHDRSAQYVCPTCGFDLWWPLAKLTVSTLGFYNDARFPGRCLLVLHQHAEDLADVDVEIANSFVQDVQRSGRAIRNATGARQMNYAVLGNSIPHVHFHIIPRVEGGDPIPTRPPWEHPRQAEPLTDAEASIICDAIVANLKVDN